MVPITWMRVIDGHCTCVQSISGSFITASDSISQNATEICSHLHAALGSTMRPAGSNNGSEFTLLNGAVAMSRFPDQPAPKPTVPPMVYVTAKTIWEYKQVTGEP